jgi:hypothetical protein
MDKSLIPVSLDPNPKDITPRLSILVIQSTSKHIAFA